MCSNPEKGSPRSDQNAEQKIIKPIYDSNGVSVAVYEDVYMYNIKIYESTDSERKYISFNLPFNAKNIFDFINIEAKLKESQSIIIYNYSDSCSEGEIKIMARWSFEAEEPYNMVDDKNKKECELIRDNNYNCDLICKYKSDFKYISNIEDFPKVLQELFFRQLDMSIIK